MKKIAILFIVAFFFFCAAGCGSSGSYKYADKANFDAYDTIRNDEFWETVSSCSTEADIGDLLGLVERIYQRDFGNLNFDWDNLMAVDTAIEVSPGVEEVKNASPSTLIGLCFYNAVFNGENGEVYLFPEYFNSEPTKQLQAITSALMHAAFATSKESQIEEGLAEYYASRFMENVGYPMKETLLPHQMTVATWLTILFGEERLVNSVRNESVPELIDSVTKPGMGQKLENALQSIYYGVDRDRAVNTVYDILAHATVGTGKSYADVGHLLEYVKEELCSHNLIQLDANYLRRVLKA